MSLGYEFAPIDVSITTHPKAFAAGIEAMGLWLWALAFAKQHRTDGRVHRPAVLGAWGGKKNLSLAGRLVEAGLWLIRDDGDWDIHNFEKKGPGYRSGSPSAERMRRLRSKRTGDAAATSQSANGDASRDVTSVTCASVSLSTSLSSSEDQDPPTRSGGRPDWFDDACDTIELQLPGEKIDRPAAWLRYEGHRSAPGSKQMGNKDAQYWLTTVDIKEARKDRERAQRQRELDAKYDRQRAGPGTLTESTPVTPEREAEAMRVFRESMAKHRAKFPKRQGAA